MEAGKSKMKVLAKSVPGERPLTGLQPSSHLLTVSSRGREREGKLSGVSFYKGTNPVMRNSSS